jgi:hypothetical protein
MWCGEGNLKLSCTAILIIIEGQLQVFQLFSSTKLVLKTIESCFVALNYCSIRDWQSVLIINGRVVQWLCGLIIIVRMAVVELADLQPRVA